MAGTKAFWGKYRASVVNNDDPNHMGRIQVKVSDVSGQETSGWAMPCVPAAGPKSGSFALPAVGAGVWVEFENGDPDFPVWVGGFWGGQNELPAPAASGFKPTSMIMQTQAENQFIMSDADGDDGGLILKVATGATVRINANGITIDTGKGAKLVLNDSGILLDNGKGAKLELQGNSMNVNGGALTVM